MEWITVVLKGGKLDGTRVRVPAPILRSRIVAVRWCYIKDGDVRSEKHYYGYTRRSPYAYAVDPFAEDVY